MGGESREMLFDGRSGWIRAESEALGLGNTPQHTYGRGRRSVNRPLRRAAGGRGGMRMRLGPSRGAITAVRIRSSGGSLGALPGALERGSRGGVPFRSEAQLPVDSPVSRDRRFSSIARLRSVVILLGVGSEISLRAALGGIEIDAFAGCRVSLSASVVSGAMTYRWYAEQNGCWGYERVQLAITTQPTLQLDGPLPFDSCWFRVDAETSGGNVVESQYST